MLQCACEDSEQYFRGYNLGSGQIRTLMFYKESGTGQANSFWRGGHIFEMNENYYIRHYNLFQDLSHTPRSFYARPKYSDEKVKNATAYTISNIGMFWENLED